MHLPPSPVAMVELVAVIFVVLVVGIVWLVSHILATSMKPTPAAELERAQQYLLWLEDRRRHAEAQNYDADMKAHIEDELDQARRQLEQSRAAVATPANEEAELGVRG